MAMSAIAHKSNNKIHLSGIDRSPVADFESAMSMSHASGWSNQDLDNFHRPRVPSTVLSQNEMRLREIIKMASKAVIDSSQALMDQSAIFIEKIKDDLIGD